MRRWATGLFLFWASACSDDSKVIDPFPIDFESTSGPVVLMASEDGSTDNALPFVVDVLSPITIVDRFEGGALPAATRRLAEITLFGLRDGLMGVPRVRFPSATTYALHLCAAETTPCITGLAGSTRDVRGILGADILSRSSVRFDFNAQTLRFFPDGAGTTAERTNACEAVFDGAFGGGSTIDVEGTQVGFGAYRPTLGVCADSEPAPELSLDSKERGTDLFMAISTGIGPTILTADAYERFATQSAAPALADLAQDTLYLPDGPVSVRLGELPYVALTGTTGADSDERGPCRELYANARMRTAEACEDDEVDCPCPGTRRSCRAGAAVEIHRAIQVAIVDSGFPLLQTLRDELRPQVPELDGVLGVQAMLDLRVEFDFPKGRLLMRCQNLDTCTTRPQVRARSSISTLDTCRAIEDERRDQQNQPDAGVIEFAPQ